MCSVCLIFGQAFFVVFVIVVFCCFLVWFFVVVFVLLWFLFLGFFGCSVFWTGCSIFCLFFVPPRFVWIFGML